MTDKITFTAICEKEPRVSDLYHAIKRLKRKDWGSWEAYKDQMRHLVGWESTSTDPDICSPQAYDQVYQTLWHEWSYTK